MSIFIIINYLLSYKNQNTEQLYHQKFNDFDNVFLFQVSLIIFLNQENIDKNLVNLKLCFSFTQKVL